MVPYSRVYDKNRLWAAWLAVKGKGSAGGADLVSIELFERTASEEIAALSSALKERRYIPEPYLDISIPKEGDEMRSIALMSVKDKIVQQALLTVMEPVLEKHFLNISYAYRPRKGAAKAIRRLQQYVANREMTTYLKCDIEKFFDQIPRSKVFARLKKFPFDADIIHLTELCLSMGKVNKQNQWIENSRGIPQGAILSPIISNLYLHQLDVWVQQKGHLYIRYADDFIILLKNRHSGEIILDKLRNFLREQLDLQLREDHILAPLRHGIPFLGVIVYGRNVGIHEEKKQHLLRKVKEVAVLKDSRLHPRYRETVGGIARYYARLLPEKELSFLDDAILLQLREALDNSSIKTIKRKEAALEGLLFVTNLFNQNITRYKRLLVQKTDTRAQMPEHLEVRWDIQQAIQQKKKTYLKKESAGLELLVTRPGVYIGSIKSGITVKERGVNLVATPTANVRHILILSRGVSFSSNLVHHCISNDIPIDFVDDNGKPFAKIYTPRTADSDLWVRQMQAAQSEKGSHLAMRMVQGKVKNQIYLVKYLAKYYARTYPEYEEAYSRFLALSKKHLDHLKEVNTRVPIVDIREKLMGTEATVAALYWDMIKVVVERITGFERRERKGATDITNSLLNYGYGILYTRIWDALLKARLNTHISYLHVPHADKPTLVYDLIEEFRQQCVDRPVISLITKGEQLKIVDGLLTIETRKRVAEKILERLNTPEVFRGTELRLSDIIRYQARAVADYLKGELTMYKPYTIKW